MEKRLQPNVRLTQTVKLRPTRATAFHAGSRPETLRPRPIASNCWVGALPVRGKLTFHEGGLEPTQDWKRVEVVFNSLDRCEANLYAGFWGQGKGTMWLGPTWPSGAGPRQRLAPRGGVRWSSPPMAETTYEEGRDFEAVADTKPGPGSLGGRIRVRPTLGPTIKITPRSRIKNGDRLPCELVSSGDHAWLAQVMCCLTEPEDREDPRRPGAAGQTSCSAPRLFSCPTTKSAWPTGA